MPPNNRLAKKSKRKKRDQQHSDSECHISTGSDVTHTTRSPVRTPGRAEVQPSTSQQPNKILQTDKTEQCPPTSPITMGEAGDCILSQEQLSQAVLQLVLIMQATQHQVQPPQVPSEYDESDSAYDYNKLFSPVILPSVHICNSAAQKTFALLLTKLLSLKGRDVVEMILSMAFNFPLLELKVQECVKQRANILAMAMSPWICPIGICPSCHCGLVFF